MKKQIMSAIAGMTLAAGVLLTGTASAAILDFTSTAVRDAVQAPTNGEIAVFGTIATVTPTNGLTWTNQDGGTCATPPLACQLDGIGISDDEVSGGTQEMITVAFASSVTLSSVYFLDLFSEINGNGREQAYIEWDGGTSGPGNALVYSALDETPNGDSGYLEFSLGGINVDQISFSAPNINPGDGLGRNDYALAALSVVPLPAALPLYGAGLALLGFLGWRKRRQA